MKIKYKYKTEIIAECLNVQCNSCAMQLKIQIKSKKIYKNVQWEVTQHFFLFIFTIGLQFLEYKDNSFFNIERPTTMILSLETGLELNFFEFVRR